MKTRVCWRYALIGLTAGLAVALASAAYAQAPTAKEAENAMRADLLHAQALEKQTSLTSISQAAALHIEEAALRPAFDVSAIDCLTLAGNLYHAAKRPFDARKTFEQAAERALSLGDIQRATLLYVNASLAATADNLPDEAARLARKADLLVESPLLSGTQREDLHRRWMHGAAPPKTDRARVATRADSLHREALALQAEPGRLTDAARLYKDEAKLRGRDDPSAVDVLILAGQLLYSANRPLEARHTMEEAGDRALGTGDISRAAFAFLDASYVAGKEGNKEETQRLAHRAELLSVSELLAPEQRMEITRRLRTISVT